MSERNIKAGVVGFGLAGKVFHAPNISAVKGLELAAVVERSGSRSTAEYPASRTVRSFEELLAVPGIELVVVATPSDTHYRMAKQALTAGKHVVIDKPFAATSAEARELDSIARSKGLVLSAFHNRRFDGDFRTVVKLLGEDTLGRLVEYEAHYDRYRPEPNLNGWKEQVLPGNGMLFDLGSHLMDQALTLFGTPRSITAELLMQRPGVRVNDGFDVTLHYDALRVKLASSMYKLEPGPRFALYGTLGSYVKYGVDPQEEALKRGERPGAAGWGEEPAEQWGTLHTMTNGTELRTTLRTEAGDYTAYYANVRDAIRGTAKLAVTAEEATRLIRALELAEESSRAGRTIAWSDR